MIQTFDSQRLAVELRRARGSRTLRQAQVEMKCISVPTIHRAEQGKDIDLVTYLTICDWLSVPASRFINVSEEDPQAEKERPMLLEDKVTLLLINKVPGEIVSAIRILIKAGKSSLENKGVDCDKS